MAFFEEMSGTPGRLLDDLVRLITTRLAGQRVAVRLGDATVELTVERIELRGVEADIETSTDDLVDVVFRLGESARRNLFDPLAFGVDAFDTFATALDRAYASGRVRPLHGEVDLAASGSARLVDVDRPGTHTASLDVRCGPVTGRFGSDFEIVVDDIVLTARIETGSVGPWLRRLGADIGSTTDVAPCADGLLRVQVGEGRLGRLARAVDVVAVVEPTVDDGLLVLSVDAVEVLGRRLGLPARYRRAATVDPAVLRPDLELRSVEVAASGVTVVGAVPRLAQPITFEQLDQLREGLAHRGTEPLGVQLTSPDRPPGIPGRPRATPASGTR